jgi:hypothetical protein
VNFFPDHLGNAPARRMKELKRGLQECRYPIDFQSDFDNKDNSNERNKLKINFPISVPLKIFNCNICISVSCLYFSRPSTFRRFLSPSSNLVHVLHNLINL